MSSSDGASSSINHLTIGDVGKKTQNLGPASLKGKIIRFVPKDTVELHFDSTMEECTNFSPEILGDSFISEFRTEDLNKFSTISTKGPPSSDHEKDFEGFEQSTDLLSSCLKWSATVGSKTIIKEGLDLSTSPAVAEDAALFSGNLIHSGGSSYTEDHSTLFCSSDEDKRGNHYGSLEYLMGNSSSTTFDLSFSSSAIDKDCLHEDSRLKAHLSVDSFLDDALSESQSMEPLLNDADPPAFGETIGNRYAGGSVYAGHLYDPPLYANGLGDEVGWEEKVAKSNNVGPLEDDILASLDISIEKNDDSSSPVDITVKPELPHDDAPTSKHSAKLKAQNYMTRTPVSTQKRKFKMKASTSLVSKSPMKATEECAETCLNGLKVGANSLTSTDRDSAVSRSVTKGAKYRRSHAKYDLAYQQMESIGDFFVECKAVDFMKMDTSSDAYKIMKNPMDYSCSTWKEGFSVRLGADGRRLLLRKLRAVYSCDLKYWRKLLHQNELDERNIFTKATVQKLFKIAHFMGEEVWNFALMCACFTNRCSALYRKDLDDASEAEDEISSDDTSENYSNKHSNSPTKTPVKNLGKLEIQKDNAPLGTEAVGSIPVQAGSIRDSNKRKRKLPSKFLNEESVEIHADPVRSVDKKLKAVKHGDTTTDLANAEFSPIRSSKTPQSCSKGISRANSAKSRSKSEKHNEDLPALENNSYDISATHAFTSEAPVDDFFLKGTRKIYGSAEPTVDNSSQHVKDPVAKDIGGKCSSADREFLRYLKRVRAFNNGERQRLSEAGFLKTFRTGELSLAYFSPQDPDSKDGTSSFNAGLEASLNSLSGGASLCHDNNAVSHFPADAAQHRNSPASVSKDDLYVLTCSNRDSSSSARSDAPSGLSCSQCSNSRGLSLVKVSSECVFITQLLQMLTFWQLQQYVMNANDMIGQRRSSSSWDRDKISTQSSKHADGNENSSLGSDLLFQSTHEQIRSLVNMIEILRQLTNFSVEQSPRHDTKSLDSQIIDKTS